MNKNKGVLFLLPDCPGYFTDLFYKMGAALKSEGYSPLFASTTAFYEKFKKVDLKQVGRVYYLDEFLKMHIHDEAHQQYEINNWSFYASFSRQTYFFGRPLNSRDTFRKTKHFYQTIFNENNVSLIVSEGVSNAFLYTAHEQATLNGIPYFGFMSSRIPYHFNIHVDITGNEVLVNENAGKSYVPSDEVPEYMNNSKFGGVFDREYSFMSPAFFKELFQFLFLKKYNSLETGNTKTFLLKVYMIAFKRIFANFFFRKILRIYERDVDFQSNRTYVVYPLHFYPEASTSIYAKYYDGNELNIIKNIAFSLREDAILVVKEHVANVGNNSRDFYKKIKRLPNVVLLDPYFKLKDNLENFDAVVTISSTVGFEALTKGVPVFVLGEIFYQKYPGCQKINSFYELEEFLSHLKKRETTEINAGQTWNIYHRICFPGSFNYMAENCLHKSNIDLLLQPIKAYLGNGELRTYHN